ncbi:hypothetical protein DRW07_13325 [Alteromonas sediminis]|uniref:GlyGly-CTERM sorting domain-containing protein n=1 Tax=Alteromonas sediminis TaxID=2259342 RepID=A0A3N5XYS6_9ALTE|nr:choice-of-anchor H family protein [Alteromonas sediminis]RPJ65790.1 hypothetical protein DRW07_13325 [Alteromonas sediminis]
MKAPFTAIVCALLLFLMAPASANDVKVNAQIPTVTNTQKSALKPLPSTKVVSQAQSQTAAAQSDYWFHDTWLTLTRDRDHDGYASSFSLTLDIDTVFSDSEVYAVVYLGDDDHYTSLYETSVFEIYGNSSSDTITLDIDLLTGYPTRDYDILIEIYDAYSNVLLAYNNLYDDADLGYQPLESSNFDVEYYQQSLVVEHHGGAFSLLFVGSLLLPLVLFRTKP